MKIRGDAERRRILRRYKAIRDDIEQSFVDIASWNDNARKPEEAPIDPDPYGDMRALSAAIHKLLTNDPGRGPIAPLNFHRPS